MIKDFAVGLIFLLLIACQDRQGADKPPEYEGPMIETDSIQTYWSDSAVVKVKLEASKQQEFLSGDQVFPEGVFITFYEDDGAISSTLKANEGFYYKEDQLYKVQGDVVLNSFERKERLNTEELFWDPSEGEVFTDKFVRIETDEEILMGEGLTAAQDFSTSKILRPTGIIQIDQEERKKEEKEEEAEEKKLPKKYLEK